MKRLFTNDRPASMWAAVAIALALAVPLYWFMDDALPRVIYNIRVLNTPVTPGESVTLLFVGDAFENCPASVQEELVDGNNIVHKVKEREGRLDVRLGPFEIEIDIPTPLDAAPGHALYRSTVAYACNPVQRIWPLVVHREVEFVFAEPESQSDLWKPQALAFGPP